MLSITDADGVAFSSVGEALDAVRQGQVTGAVVPIENSVEGGVSATLDKLVDGDPLIITGEVVIPVEFGLYVRPGTSLGDVASVLTHGHAAAQCRDWLATIIPSAQVTEAGSTAGGGEGGLGSRVPLRRRHLRARRRPALRAGGAGLLH